MVRPSSGRQSIVIGFGSFLLLSIAGAQGTADVRAIRAARESSNQALSARNIDGFADSLAPDFVMVRGNGVFVPSREAYIELIRGDFKDPNSVRYQRVPDKIEISKAAALAAEHGHWTGTLANGKRGYHGTYLAMWRRTGNGWKIRSELFVVLGCDDEATCAGYRK